MPSVSVIVPVYKVEPYLHRCVDSILAQTFTDFELILVDDGSPDNCGAICDEYAAQDSRIHVIHQQNGGLSAARNTGIDWAFANSDNQWLTFIDSDDWVHPEYLERLVQTAHKYNVAVSVCLYTRATSTGEFLDHFSFSQSDQLFSFDEYFAVTGWGYTPYIACAKLIRKDCLQDLRFPVNRVSEDLFTTHKILYHSSFIARVNIPLYYYFLSNNSIMRSTWTPKRLDEVLASERLIAFMRRKKCQKAEKTALKRYLWILETNIRQIQEKKTHELKKYERKLNNRIRYLLLFYRKTILPYDAIGKYNEKYFPKLTKLKRRLIRIIDRIKRMLKRNADD